MQDDYSFIVKKPKVMLAERVESSISREHATWEATMEKTEKDQTK